MPDTAREGLLPDKDNCYSEIDPRPFQAASDRARGTTRRGKGHHWRNRRHSLSKTRRSSLERRGESEQNTTSDVDKYAPLNQERAIRQRDMDNCNAEQPRRESPGGGGQSPSRNRKTGTRGSTSNPASIGCKAHGRHRDSVLTRIWTSFLRIRSEQSLSIQPILACSRAHW